MSSSFVAVVLRLVLGEVEEGLAEESRVHMERAVGQKIGVFVREDMLEHSADNRIALAFLGVAVTPKESSWWSTSRTSSSLELVTRY